MFLLLSSTYLWDLYRTRYSLVRSPLGLLEAGGWCPPYKCTVQTGSKLDFVHLSGITDDGNQALKKSGGDINYLGFLIDH